MKPDISAIFGSQSILLYETARLSIFVQGVNRETAEAEIELK